MSLDLWVECPYCRKMSMELYNKRGTNVLWCNLCEKEFKIAVGEEIKS